MSHDRVTRQTKLNYDSGSPILVNALSGHQQISPPPPSASIHQDIICTGLYVKTDPTFQAL